MLLVGCATVEDVSPESCEFHYSFAPAKTQQTTFTNSRGVTWNIDTALICAGEIGIHWSWKSTVATREVRHDVSGGKISPKIYGYFAIDLLKPQNIQTLQVSPGLYDHIHMLIVNSSAVDTVYNGDMYPMLTGHSLYFSGTVSNGDDEYRFVLTDNGLYDENSMGDILFEMEVFHGQEYAISVSPDFELWFEDVLWSNLEIENDVVHIGEGKSARAVKTFINRFTQDNLVGVTFERIN